MNSVDSIKDLGVVMSCDLEFTNHCTITAKKASIRMNRLLRSFVTKEMGLLKKCFNTFV